MLVDVEMPNQSAAANVRPAVQLIGSGITLSPCQRRPFPAHVAELGR